MNLYGISLLLFLRRKDPDAGSESGMTGRKTGILTRSTSG
jgi:hypothetical protein